MKYNSTVFNPALKIFSFLFLLNSGWVWSQGIITGMVMEKETGYPLSYVTVKNTDQRMGVITNDSGYFKLNARPGEILVFSKTGFTTYEIVVKSGENNLKIELSLSDNALDEVVISAGRNNQSLKNTSISMEVIKPYIINNKNPATAENTIDQIPGVQTINGQVVIRSGSGWSYGTGSRVAIMVDGMPLASGDAGQVQWSFIPIENIESMEVIKGASSVLFGSSALNGVINIRTAKPGLTPVTKVSTFFSVFDKPANENFEWNGGKLLYTTGIRAFHSQRKGNNSLSLNLNGFKDVGYRMSDEDNRIRIGAQYQRDIKRLNGYSGINTNYQIGRSSSFLLWESDELAYTAMDSSFTENKTSRFNIDPFLVVYKRGWKHLLQGRYLNVSNEVLQVSTNVSQSNYSNLVFGEYQVSRQLKSRIHLIAGITGSFVKSNSPLYQGIQTSNNGAAYIQTTMKAGKWNLDAGMRYERYRLNKYKEGKPVVRAGFSRELTKATFLRASFGQGYRFPTIAESYVSTIVGPLKIFPNNELKSETGWNAEIGVKQGLRFGKINAILDLAVFRMEYDRMMEFTFGQWERNFTTQGFGFKSLNVSNATIDGIDLSFAGAFKKKNSEWKWLCGYTYARAIATEPDKVFYVDSLGNQLSFVTTSSDPEGNFLKYRPKHLVRIDIQYEWKKWEIGASLRYNSYLQNIDRAFVSFPIGLVVPGIQDARDRGKDGDYIIDLRFGKTIGTWKYLFLVNNLLNRVYMTRPCDMRPPRSFMIQVNKSF